MDKIDLGNTKGLTRRLDNLGRVTLPKEFRNELNIKDISKVEIFMVQDGIFIREKKV